MSVFDPRAWEFCLECHRCGAGEGTPCQALDQCGNVLVGTVRTRPHVFRPRRPYRLGKSGRPRDTEIEEIRLKTWKRCALQGVPVEDIANQLRMTRAALDRYVIRARKRGHPHAVYHIRAVEWAEKHGRP